MRSVGGFGSGEFGGSCQGGVGDVGLLPVPDSLGEGSNQWLGGVNVGVRS